MSHWPEPEELVAAREAKEYILRSHSDYGWPHTQVKILLVKKGGETSGATCNCCPNGQ